ncbi:HAD family hydrolase [Neobacillus cucumis]|uniref:Cof-type HAD-IIB family hydrolase n=1 Tax=Neobacillus cucumis TaxID=1740721 RepID=A0A2N5HB41_9BACI|nr:HAD family hydrolase [Neobacillus cucumis]PLS02749.1 Cof-type HAD-IIB family hydrolase [Neobacillus cucumis]
MTQYKVLFLDIDGTLVTPDNRIEESTKKAVAQVQDQGIEVFLATGRPLHEINDLAAQLNIHSFIGYNGAYAVYKGADIFQEPLEKSLVNHYLEIAHEHNHDAVLYTNKENIFTNLDAPFIHHFIDVFHFHKNEVYSSEFDRDVLGITMINLKPEDTSLYESEAGIHLSQVNVEGLKHCYDVIRDKINKGYGIQMLLKYLDIPKESSIAFGDGMNDKEMLHAVGESFAMGNGHPDIFQYAKHRTTEVTNSGIFNGLKMLGLVE